VLVIASITSEAGAAVAAKAKAQGIPVIDYDRLNLGGTSDCYVSFDNTEVGELQGQGLVQGVGAKPGAQINDAELGALAEHVRGVARNVDDLVCISADFGVGGGIISDGRPLRGTRGYVGELGHLVVRPGGRPARWAATPSWWGRRSWRSSPSSARSERTGTGGRRRRPRRRRRVPHRPVPRACRRRHLAFSPPTRPVSTSHRVTYDHRDPREPTIRG